MSGRGGGDGRSYSSGGGGVGSAALDQLLSLFAKYQGLPTNASSSSSYLLLAAGGAVLATASVAVAMRARNNHQALESSNDNNRKALPESSSVEGVTIVEPTKPKALADDKNNISSTTATSATTVGSASSIRVIPVGDGSWEETQAVHSKVTAKYYKSIENHSLATDDNHSQNDKQSESSLSPEKASLSPSPERPQGTASVPSSPARVSPQYIHRTSPMRSSLSNSLAVRTSLSRSASGTSEATSASPSSLASSLSIPPTTYVPLHKDTNKGQSPMHVPAPSVKPQNHYALLNSNNTIKVAFVGNSILFFNDCPRLVQQMLETNFATVIQNSCLRGGASLVSLWKDGNGMHKVYRHADGSFHDDVGAPTVKALFEQDQWNFVILNDQTQAPCRQSTKQATKKILEEQYAALLEASGACPIFLQTAAYREKGLEKSDDLGDFEEFSDRLQVGYREYAQFIRTQSSSSTALLPCRVAPVGEAVRWLYRHDPALWQKVYAPDGFHFSPLGTWLEACVLYCTLIHEFPPDLDPAWWNNCRRVVRSNKVVVLEEKDDDDALVYPTEEEASELRRVACLVCGVPNFREKSNRRRSW